MDRTDRGLSVTLFVVGALLVALLVAGVVYTVALDGADGDQRPEATGPSVTPETTGRATTPATASPATVDDSATSSPVATSTREPTPTPTRTPAPTPSPTATPGRESDDTYESFLLKLGGQFAKTSTPLRIRGIEIDEANATMWLVYNGTDAAVNSSARQREWGEFARSYGFALREFEAENGTGEVPILLRVVEANTSSEPESTIRITSHVAKLYAYEKLGDDRYATLVFQSLRKPTERERRRAARIDASSRNRTFYADGTREYTEPPK